MKRMKAIVALLLAVAMVVGLVGCGSSSSSSSSSSSTSDATSDAADDSADSTDASGRTISTSDLNIMIETAVESLDPQIATDGTSFEVIADFMDGLMQMDENGTAICAIAESYEVSEDGLTWTFYLREDAYWSNGTPVTAADFVFAWQRAVDPDVASEYAFMMSDCAQLVNAEAIINGEMDKSELGVYAEDDYTLVCELNVPVSYFLSLMYFPTFYPINEEFYNSVGDLYGTSPDTVLANGAFILDEYEPAATSFHLTKNEDYYDADKVQLAGLSYQLIQDSQQALMSFQSGDLDITLINGDQVEQVEDDPEFTTMGAGYLWYVSPNIDGVEELANLNIRMALTLAIDRETITDSVLMDGSMPTYTAVPMQFAAGPDGSDFSEDQTLFSEYCRFDADSALEYWEAGLAELGVSEITLDLLCDSDDAPQKVAAVLQEMWQTTLPGLTINIVVEVKKQRVADMQDGNYELGLTRWGPDYADPMTYLNMWITGNSNNYGLWSNEEYDAIIAECTTGDLCTDEEARWARLYDAEEIVLSEAVIFPIYGQSNALMVSSNVEGIEYHAVALNRVYKNAVKYED